MISRLTNLIIESIKNHGSLSIFWGAIIEQLAGVLIPSPLIPMSAGYLLIPKHVSFFQSLILIIQKISFPYSLGASLGASVLFFVAYFGGRTLIKKFGRFFGVSLNEIDKFRRRFTKGWKDELLILVLLTIPVTSISLVSASCALIGISFLQFFPLLLAATFFRSIILAFLGWKVGETYEQVTQNLESTQTLVSIGLLGIVFLLFVFLYLKREKFFNNAE